MCSPQFHCYYDDLFETPKLDPANDSLWQKLAHFDDQEQSYQPDPKFFPEFSRPTKSREGGSASPSTSNSARKRRRSPKRTPSTESVTEPESENKNSARRAPMNSNDDDDETDHARCEGPDTSEIDEETQENEGDPEQDLEEEETPDEPVEETGQNKGDVETSQSDESNDDDESGKAERDIDSRIDTANIITGGRTRTRTQDYKPSFYGKSHAASFLTEVHDAVSFMATEADPDTMTLKQALQEPDADQFLLAMEKEVNDHVTRKHWKLVTNDDMRKAGYKGKPIMAVWPMKRKRNPLGEIVKYKARLCAHGGQTIKGIHYTNTFAPVVTWTTIRFLLILSLVHNWHTRQIDFVLAYPQAKVSHDLYMHIPERFRVEDNQLKLDKESRNPFKAQHKLRLLQNLCGLKDAGATWFSHLQKGLLKRKFKQSEVGPCLFYKKDLILIIYVDDCILMTPKPALVDEFLASMKTEYKLEDEGDISAHLGINVTRPAHDVIKLNQPALIKRIVDSIGLKDQRQHDTPAEHGKLIHKDTDGPPRKMDFHYRSLIGQLNYLTSSTRPDIQFATHQCARYCNDPKLSHEVAAKRIVRYLKGTMEQGLTLKVDKSKGFECYVDADFAGGYSDANALDPQSCLSRTGYVITYANCPIIWSSKMQSTISLSTTEAECVALSSALRDVIFLVELVQEFELHGAPIPKSDKPLITCRTFEDNVGALELANNPKLRPRTKHIAVQFHHFRSYVQRKLITVQHASTTEQIAGIFTKALPRPAFLHLRSKLMGW